MNCSSQKIAALIATKNRPKELIERSIRSVLAQTNCPDYLIIIDDSDEKYQQRNQKALAEIDLAGIKLIYKKNYRTPGISGALNEGLISLVNLTKQPELWFVAILDDDDSWEADYLEKCAFIAAQNKLNMVAADIIRIEDVNGPSLTTFAPTKLGPEDALVTNPGIQGSSLFVQLDILLMAGLFDEDLRSTTDRDICIRLAETGKVRFARLPERLVKHYAESDRDRLTSRGSIAKIQGLTSFWKKYSPRMNDSRRSAFKVRARCYFDWIEPGQKYTEMETITCRNSENPQREGFLLNIGVISGDRSALEGFLESAKKLEDLSYLKGLNIIVLENGTDLSGLITERQKSGQKIEYYSESQQRKDQLLGCFGAQFKERPLGKQVAIAFARTMLQVYVGRCTQNLLQANEKVYSWILDDDMRIDERAKSYLSWLPAFARDGVDVLLGAYEGASPNPPLNGLRVQLVDILHNLLWLNGLDEKIELPNKCEENRAFREKYPDYYYDFSRKHYGHLERPMWLEADHPGERVGEAKKRLCENAFHILNGFPLTRPLLSEHVENPIASAKDSVNRGGTTFILNNNALMKTPNIAVNTLGVASRRSDMIWAVVNRYYYGMTIKKVSFPIKHLGRVPSENNFKETTEENLRKVSTEMVGASFYAGLMAFLKENKEHKLDFSDEEICIISQSIQHDFDRRLSALRRSYFRLEGLVGSLETMNDNIGISKLVSHIKEIYSPQSFKQIEAAAQLPPQRLIAQNLLSLRSKADSYASQNETKHQITCGEK